LSASDTLDVCKDTEMLYRKNLYSWEQIARVASGIALAVFVLLQMPAGWIAYTLAACGLAFALTGAFGWCPACATVGRRLKERQIS